MAVGRSLMAVLVFPRLGQLAIGTGYTIRLYDQTAGHSVGTGSGFAYMQKRSWPGTDLHRFRIANEYKERGRIYGNGQCTRYPLSTSAVPAREPMEQGAVPTVTPGSDGRDRVASSRITTGRWLPLVKS
jgi:hypothetical protein